MTSTVPSPGLCKRSLDYCQYSMAFLFATATDSLARRFYYLRSCTMFYVLSASKSKLVQNNEKKTNK